MYLLPMDNQTNTLTQKCSAVITDTDYSASDIELIKVIKRYEYCVGWTMLIAPDHLPNKTMLRKAGVNLDKVLILHKSQCQDSLIAAYKALKSETCSALVVWDNVISKPEFELLKIKAEFVSTSLYLLHNRGIEKQLNKH